MIIDLNQEWRVREKGKDAYVPATIPGFVHTDLLNTGVIEDPFFRDNEARLQWIGKTDWEYRRHFSVNTSVLEHEKIDMVFEGLDTYAKVYLNDSLALEADNMFRAWRVDCKALLQKGENILVVRFRSPINEVLPRMQKMKLPYPAISDPEGTSPFTRKAPYHFGWDWGPRFVTCGIWRPVYLHAWDQARVSDLFIVQNHLDENIAEMSAHVELTMTGGGTAVLEVFSSGSAFEPVQKTIELQMGVRTYEVDFRIPNPDFWWPNGLGSQRLYGIRTKLVVGGEERDVAHKRIGLRTVELRQQNDDFGKSFEFAVNGLPVFAKGANWIPADSFTTRIDRKRYEHLIWSAKDANMNMLRVWGGGIYEHENFYELCDEMGILVWQDFMFSCSMYPASQADLANVEQEAIHQIRRLRNYPCIVLWCGNNEVETGWKEWGWSKRYPSAMWAKDYMKLFHGLLPRICNEYDPSRAYWPSSPSSNLHETAQSQTSGDVHYWGVWHAQHPFEDYLKQTPRFLSEYGFQSFPAKATVGKFALPDDFDIESEVMRAHQKHPQGNRLIQTYALREYNEPKDFAAFLYVSQVLQAEGLKLGTEHYRRIRPRCMGALYWQINDCWPVASWSSIDYYGNWKALHYFAKRFFAPVLLSIELKNDAIGIHVTSDEQEPVIGEIHVFLMTFNGQIRQQKTERVVALPNRSQQYVVVGKDKWLREENRAEVFLYVEFKSGQKLLADNTFFFLPAKELSLPAPEITADIAENGDTLVLTLFSFSLAKNVYLRADGVDGFFSDNFFNLLPGQKFAVEFRPKNRIDIRSFKDQLKVTSLVDAF
jgi:beta-mannosidase